MFTITDDEMQQLVCNLQEDYEKAEAQLSDVTSKATAAFEAIQRGKDTMKKIGTLQT
jgi:hypothetical protein